METVWTTHEQLMESVYDLFRGLAGNPKVKLLIQYLQTNYPEAYNELLEAYEENLDCISICFN